MICGETSVPQIGGAKAVDKIFRPIAWLDYSKISKITNEINLEKLIFTGNTGDFQSRQEKSSTFTIKVFLKLYLFVNKKSP